MRCPLLALALSAAALTGVTGCGLLPWMDSEPEPLPMISGPDALQVMSIAPVFGPEEYKSHDWTGRLQKALLQVKGLERVTVVS